MESLSSHKCSHIRWVLSSALNSKTSIVDRILYSEVNNPISLYGAKLYLMDDGRWLIMDYLNIPDAPRHYIDCIEGSICNMNVRIISESTKVEIEKNQEIFNELT